MTNKITFEDLINTSDDDELIDKVATLCRTFKGYASWWSVLDKKYLSRSKKEIYFNPPHDYIKIDEFGIYFSEGTGFSAFLYYF